MEPLRPSIHEDIRHSPPHSNTNSSIPELDNEEPMRDIYIPSYTSENVPSPPIAKTKDTVESSDGENRSEGDIYIPTFKFLPKPSQNKSSVPITKLQEYTRSNDIEKKSVFKGVKEENKSSCSKTDDGEILIRDRAIKDTEVIMETLLSNDNIPQVTEKGNEAEIENPNLDKGHDEISGNHGSIPKKIPNFAQSPIEKGQRGAASGKLQDGALDELLGGSTRPTPVRRYLRITFPACLKEDAIQFYFENTKKSGGGDICQFIYIPINKEVLIEFEDHAAVDRVHQKKHEIDGVNLSVSIKTGEIPSRMEERKLLLCNLNPKTSLDCLENFLEVRTKANLLDVCYNRTKDRAIVTFDTEPDFENLKRACQTKKLEGHLVNISQVPVSRCVLVTGLPESVTEDSVSLYFENKRRSNGGEVEQVVINRAEKKCFIYFKDAEVAQRVCGPNQILKLDESILKVTIFYSFLESSEKEGVTSVIHPVAVLLEDIDKHIINFVMNSAPNKEGFCTMIEKVNGIVEWPANPEKEYVKIIYAIQFQAESAERWSKEVHKNVEKFFSVMTTQKVKVLETVRDSFLTDLSKINVPYPDAVAVIVKRPDSSVIIAGHAKYVKDVRQRIEIIARKAEQSLMQGNYAGIILPKCWRSMLPSDLVKQVILSPSDKEYEVVAQKFMASCGFVTIQQIKQIQNKYLYQHYCAKKQELLIRNKRDSEKWLWYGTSKSASKEIISNGFNWSYCGKPGTNYGTSVGNGIYFTVNASYSTGSCQAEGDTMQMFYSQVLTGETCLDKADMRLLPRRQDLDITYDSAADNVHNPCIYVIFDSSQAYPAYLISFKLQN